MRCLGLWAPLLFSPCAPVTADDDPSPVKVEVQKSQIDVEVQKFCPYLSELPDVYEDVWRRLHTMAMLLEEEKQSAMDLRVRANVFCRQLKLLKAAVAGEVLPTAQLANSCPSLFALYFESAAEVAFQLRQPRRSRALLQLGTPLRLMALSRTLFTPTETREQKDWQSSLSKRYHDKLKTLVDYGPEEREWELLNSTQGRELSDSTRASARVEIHSLCDIRWPGANLENVTFNVSEQNHRAYATRWGYSYTMHQHTPLGEQEPQYGKIQIAIDAMEREDPPDWFLWLDCDTLVGNRSISVDDLLNTYDLQDVAWAVAEETSGINTGVFLVQGGSHRDRSLQFLKEASSSPWRFVWDQSMFLHQMAKDSDLFAESVCQVQDLDDGLSMPDFAWSTKFRTLPQKAMNLYGEGSALQWGATAWKPGDFVLHLAGCPLVEKECRDTFDGVASWIELNN